jgi:hypothetical protein
VVGYYNDSRRTEARQLPNGIADTLVWISR